MKIALVVHDFTRSLGHGRYAFELARRFRHEHDVHVFANRFDRDATDGITIHHVPAVRANALSTILSFTLPATLQLGRGWDIIHAQGACCVRFNVITAHICNAGWADAQRTARTARTWRQGVFERVVTPIERATFRHSRNAQAIAISAQVRDELARYYGRRDSVTVIHHGVDAETFAPVDAAQRRALRSRLGVADGFVALFVGDLRKGADVALEVIAKTPRVHLVCVSRSAAGPYEQKAAALGVLDRVAFHPPTDEIASYYALADAFLFPSPYDAFGMVVSEAMASALPVITTRAAGASELIVHGHSGFVVDSATAPAPMAEHLARLERDPSLAHRIGRAARDAVSVNTWDDVAARTMAIYARAVRLR